MSQKLVANLKSQDSGDVVFAVAQTDGLQGLTDTISKFNYLYAWKDCLLVGDSDNYFRKRRLLQLL